ncbi:Histidinol-phosphate aminotransferase 2 [Photorhabdus australis subsp. thailandensis]|uniref:Aminotransferase n=2 Tax=Photorhabdus australis TaxID=286156 RepID=A0A1C0TYL1_9GAMM|nr:Histidinol-phosphate aminotransferase 2 [Photorhabdus australis subsp. thailandensis]
MLHSINSRIQMIRRTKENKRQYLNLKSNENLVTDDPLFFRTLLNNVDPIELLKYPVYDDIYHGLKLHLGVENIVLTSGCHDAIRVLFSSLEKKKNKVLLTIPNYDGYSLYLDINEIPYVQCSRTPDNQFDLSYLYEQALRHQCNLLILTNPDPFVGDCFERDQITVFLQICKDSGITVILDEVYSGFGRDSDITLTKTYDNLLVLNSLSKSYGLPGLRVGWIAGNIKNIEDIGCLFPESTLSGISLYIAHQLIKKPDFLLQYRNSIQYNRIQLINQMVMLECIETYTQSVSNFVLFKLLKTVSPGQLWKELLSQGIYVANLNHIPGFENHYRVTVCKEDARGKLIDSIKRF